MNDRELKTQIREFLARTFPLARSRQITDSDSLLMNGIVDSMGVLDIVEFLESELRVTLSDEEMLADNFESIEKIARFVAAKKAGSTD